MMKRLLLPVILLVLTLGFVASSDFQEIAAGVAIFLFGMLIYGATNLVAYVPSAIRFYSIGEMLILAAVVLFFGSSMISKRADRQIAASLAPLLTINVALGVRYLLEFASLYLLIGNFFIAPFVKGGQGLYEIVKSIL